VRLDVPARRPADAHRGERGERHALARPDPSVPCPLDPVPSLGRHVDVVEIQLRQRRRQRVDPIPERSSRVQEYEFATLDEATASAARGRRLERLDPDLDAEACRDAHQLVEEVPVIHSRPLAAPHGAR
jgi:hypothetical protein